MNYGLGSDDPEELAYYNKIRKEMDDVKKDFYESLRILVMVYDLLFQVPSSGLEPETSPLPRECSTAELQGQF